MIDADDAMKSWREREEEEEEERERLRGGGVLQARGGNVASLGGLHACCATITHQMPGARHRCDADSFVGTGVLILRALLIHESDSLRALDFMNLILCVCTPGHARLTGPSFICRGVLTHVTSHKLARPGRTRHNGRQPATSTTPYLSMHRGALLATLRAPARGLWVSLNEAHQLRLDVLHGRRGLRAVSRLLHEPLPTSGEREH